MRDEDEGYADWTTSVIICAFILAFIGVVTAFMVISK